MKSGEKIELAAPRRRQSKIQPKRLLRRSLPFHFAWEIPSGACLPALLRCRCAFSPDHVQGRTGFHHAVCTVGPVQALSGGLPAMSREEHAKSIETAALTIFGEPAHLT